MRRTIYPTILVGAAVLALAACTGGSAAHSGSSHPIIVGLINTEDAPVGSFPDLRLGALAAQRYVNDTYGGVDGRRLEIASCITSGTPESSQTCANQLLARHPVAVIGGVDLGAAASLPPLQSAGVPYVGGTPVATEALTSGGAFMLTGGTATEVLGEVAYAVDTLHVTRMAAVYSNVPGLLSQAASLLGTIVHNEGVNQFKLVPVEADAPDVVPALSAAASSHPQATIAVFPAQSCVRVIQGVAAIGLKTRMMFPSFCAAANVLAAGGPAVDGSVIASGYTPYVDRHDHDVNIYLSALQRYDPTLQPSLLSQAGFSVVMVLHQLLSDIGGNSPTPAMLTAKLRASHNDPNFMSHPFTCDGKQVPLLGALCNANVKISVIAHGQLHPLGSWVDTAPVARLAIP